LGQDRSSGTAPHYNGIDGLIQIEVPHVTPQLVIGARAVIGQKPR
jgi:hypothetical protein